MLLLSYIATCVSVASEQWCASVATSPWCTSVASRLWCASGPCCTSVASRPWSNQLPTSVVSPPWSLSGASGLQCTSVTLQMWCRSTAAWPRSKSCGSDCSVHQWHHNLGVRLWLHDRGVQLWFHDCDVYLWQQDCDVHQWHRDGSVPLYNMWKMCFCNTPYHIIAVSLVYKKLISRSSASLTSYEWTCKRNHVLTSSHVILDGINWQLVS